jgi:hypothetical protein
MYCLCANIPLQEIARTKSNLDHLLHVRISSSHDTTHSLLSLQSHTTCLPPGHRRPPISAIPTVHRPTRDSQQPVFIRLRQLLHFTSPMHAAPPVQPRNPLDVSCVSDSSISAFTIDSTMAPQVPATSPLPSSLSGQTATQFNHVSLNFLVNSHHDRVLTAYQVRNEFSPSLLERSRPLYTTTSFFPRA